MTDNPMKQKPAGRFLREVFELLESFAVAVVLVILIFTLLFRIFVVKGPSMLSTLKNGDRIVVSNLFFSPDTGDVIVFSGDYNDGEVLVKRVIGTYGDVVDIAENGSVILNGEVLDEPYLDSGTLTSVRDVEMPYTVKEGELFVLGDNRGLSLDSRASEIGPAQTKKVLGKVIFRLFPNTGVVKDGK